VGPGVVIGGLLTLGAFFLQAGRRAEEASDELDHLKARADSLGGTVERSTDRLKALTSALELVIARSANLEEDAEALDIQILSTQARFAEWGLTIDENKFSVDGLIESLQALGKELNSIRLVDLNSQILSQKEVVRALREIATDNIKEVIELRKGTLLTAKEIRSRTNINPDRLILGLIMLLIILPLE